ncbi:MAG: hypothetical protein K1X77_02035, partial [Bacteroidia bacterium]|nr:hypothetical protein [Bacteroidia bacterium]
MMPKKPFKDAPEERRKQRTSDSDTGKGDRKSASQNKFADKDGFKPKTSGKKEFFFGTGRTVPQEGAGENNTRKGSDRKSGFSDDRPKRRSFKDDNFSKGSSKEGFS